MKRTEAKDHAWSYEKCLLLSSGKGLQYSEHFFPKYKYQPGNEAESTEITQKAVIRFVIMYWFSADSYVIAWTEIKEQEQVRLEQF